MTKRKQSDFREDRDNNCDLPHLDDVKTVAQQYAYQRPLRKKWDECLDKPPLAMMDLPRSSGRRAVAAISITRRLIMCSAKSNGNFKRLQREQR